MVLAIIAVIILLIFLISGYRFSAEGELNRQGLLQVSSIPTMATVTIDGVEGSWLERTNTSKNLSSDTHTVVLTKDGYDTWSKEINVHEGLLYRLHYPRLFLTDREKEPVLDTKDYTFATISPDHAYMLLTNGTTKWAIVDLNDETLKPEALDVTELFTTTANAPAEQKTQFTGTIEDVRWDHDSSHALFKVKFGDNTEWLLLDVKNPKESVNISKEFGGNFADIQILDNSSGNLLVIQNGNLHKIDLGSKSLSSVLVENVQDFDHYNQNEVIFSAKNPDSESAEDAYYVGTFKLGDSDIKKLTTTSNPTKVALSKFYEDKYVSILDGSHLTVYLQDDFSPVMEFDLSFSPETMDVGHEGEFITMTSSNHIATLDMEAQAVREWDAEGEDYDWIDNDMLFSIKDGNLIVYDFDGLNRRELASGASANFPAAITDDKWLYYFSDGQLIREWLVTR